jgi:chemotaxis protein CheD
MSSAQLMHKARRGRFHDKVLDREFVRVLPGDYFATLDNLAITTVLGSCVAACIYDAQLPVGGMNHFMLPTAGVASGSEAGASGRYGIFAMEMLINELLKLGATRSRLRAKVFGGGRVIKGMTSINVGERNAEFVLEFLGNERIPVVSQDMLDIFARKVLFFPLTGRALVKRIDPDAEESVLSTETEYRKALEKRPIAGDVELF